MSTEPANCIFYHFDSDGNSKGNPEIIASASTTLGSLGEEACNIFGAKEPYFLCSPDCADEGDRSKTLAPSMSPGMYDLPDGARINLVEFTNPETIDELIEKVSNAA